MNTEIERKFLVNTTNFKNESFKTIVILQGYLNSDKNRTVRVRVADDKAFLTIKGISNQSGTTRFEWEKEIDKKEAEVLLTLCEPFLIEKRRYLVKVGKHVFEVDEFFGENKGLLVAEIELQTEDEIFTKPNWLGLEVTGDNKYYNASLSKIPFKKWS